MQLREYQTDCLSRLTAYFKSTVEVGSAKKAFVLQTERPYYDVPQLPGMPYVCLRVPTGGGKTILASYTVGLATRHLLQASRSVCLWLVPTNVIRAQTLKALRDRAHPYRLALESELSGDLTVMDLNEGLYLPAGPLSDSTVIIVSTLAALRVEDPEGRKIYEQSGALKPHFDDLLPEQLQTLDKWPNGEVVKSLANLLRLHRPIVIVDEAHNARTTLSFETLLRVTPSCILEYTATPELTSDPVAGRYPSNVLHHVSAAELKAADMIKLPVRLFTHPDWKEVIARALDMQRNLEHVAADEASETGEYIRPIVLFQAQQRNQQGDSITPEALKPILIGDFNISPDQIAIATGSTRELEDIDLFDPRCPIRFIITVQALREGWDCSFAYMLCSIAEIRSARAIEQLLGRVLRMPQAKRKIHEELNCAYAFSASSAFAPIVLEFQEALVENGFERLEVADLIVPPFQPPLLAGPLFAGKSAAVYSTPKLEKLPADLRERVTFDATSQTITIGGAITQSALDSVRDCFEDAKSRSAIESIPIGVESADRDKPRISVPLLAVRQQDQLEVFEQTVFREVPWDLAKCDPTLSEDDFNVGSHPGHAGELDVTAEGRITTKFIEELQSQLALIEAEPGWTIATLTLWLDRRIPHPDIPQSQSELFIHKTIDHCIQSRAIPIDILARHKFALASAIEVRIAVHRKTHERDVFQSYLFGDNANRLVVDPEVCFTFTDEKYCPNWYYDGGYHFDRHYFKLIGELKTEGEEFKCAQFIDTMPEVVCWVRNLERRPLSSFWLQTSDDKFYPDFVAVLSDGRILVVEYKGSIYWSNDDSKEKRAIGDLWAAKTNGKCVFIMPNGTDLQAISAAIR